MHKLEIGKHNLLDNLMLPRGYLLDLLINSATANNPEVVSDAEYSFVVRRYMEPPNNPIVFDNKNFLGLLGKAAELSDVETIENLGLTIVQGHEAARMLQMAEDKDVVLAGVMDICKNRPKHLYGHTTGVDVYGPYGDDDMFYVGFKIDGAGKRRARGDRSVIAESIPARSFNVRNISSRINFLKTTDVEIAVDIKNAFSENLKGFFPMPFDLSSARLVIIDFIHKPS